jgi:hypothetical protein
MIKKPLYSLTLIIVKLFREDINGCQFDYVLISRRGCARTGARYHMRGADAQGYVANFVETEQLVLYDGLCSSFVQIRGSIPIIWNQRGKSLKPKPVAEQSFLTVCI